MTFSHNGKYRATIVNNDARPVVSILETATNAPVPLPAVPDASVAGLRFSPSETKLSLSISGDRSPNNLYTLDLATKKLTKVTDSMMPQIDAADLVDAEVVRFRARDGMTVPNILWKPHQAAPTTKAPALVYVHGGPGGQTTPAYNALVPFLANHGADEGGLDESRSVRSDPAHDYRGLPDGAHVSQHVADAPSSSRYVHDLHR
jgi:dipeptidyl aminopeptidase/acylaminoacyl peptidase